MSPRKPVIEEIDYLRGFAFLAVVMQHVVGHYAFEPKLQLADGVLLGILLLLAKFAVPLFIFITGLVLFYNYDSGVAYGPFLRKRSRDILLPYLPWAVLYAFIVMGGSAFSSWEGLQKFGRLLFTGEASYHLWYIVMTFQLYLLFPLLRKAVLWLDRRAGRSGAALLVFGGLLYVWYAGHHSLVDETMIGLRIPVLSDLFGEYRDRNSWYFLYYFVLGAAAGLYLPRWKEWIVRWHYVIIAAYAAVNLYLLYRIVSHFELHPELVMRYNDTFLVQPHMAVFLIVSVLAMHAMSIRFGNLAPARLKRLIKQAGSYSYTAYLAHALVLQAAVWAADLTAPAASVIVRSVLSFLLCAAGSVGAAMLLRRAAQAWQKRRA
ncbi:acyltransferase [Paenibacillus caseinilyticus]|uniref:Acyltransferase n=1 Tax=Paenibacillus mucilaginosus K02 TaxID=997761 RepID=I0BCT3_9BACL|nr:acyltransferase [Paenibacillus mucilaginosus]AFH60180.1 acyltransferase [Paenibacillus mucilaginosus K02]